MQPRHRRSSVALFLVIGAIRDHNPTAADRAKNAKRDGSSVLWLSRTHASIQAPTSQGISPRSYTERLGCPVARLRQFSKPSSAGPPARRTKKGRADCGFRRNPQSVGSKRQSSSHSRRVIRDRREDETSLSRLPTLPFRAGFRRYPTIDRPL
jgi:hypothetical protein